MKKNIFILVIMLMLAFASKSLFAAPMTGIALKALYDGTASQHFNAAFYIQGVEETLFSYGTGIYCEPANTSNQQIEESVEKYFNAHPELLNKSATVLIGDALSQTYPCPKQTTKPLSK